MNNCSYIHIFIKYSITKRESQVFYIEKNGEVKDIYVERNGDSKVIYVKKRRSQSYLRKETEKSKVFT